MPAETTNPQEFLAEERPAPPIDPAFRRLRVFAYTVEGLAPTYRAVMAVFTRAKARYRIQLRPDEVRAELEGGARPPVLPEGGLERALDQLVEWGNLSRSHDTGRVATLADFRRRHFLYQITPAGEAAERAVAAVIEALESSGSLQTVMLGAILRNLATLAEEMRRAPDETGGAAGPRPAVLYEGLFNVTRQLEALTENAGTFMTRLHEAIDASEVRLEAFTAYKQAVIAYLEEFISELAALSPRIEALLSQIEGLGVERMFRLAARADEAPTLEGVRDVSSRLAEQWRGLGHWFLGDGREEPTLMLLRGAARGAINRILRVLEQLHEKRFRRVSRRADLLCLARWLEAAEDDVAAHRLFASAFALHSARHLGGLDEEREMVRPADSWWRTAPVRIAPVMRSLGRAKPTGRAARIVDHSAARRRLAAAHRRRHERFLRALERFAGRGPLPLGELGRLEPEEFGLLLELLDRLLALPEDDDGVRMGPSRDGRLRLRLEPPPVESGGGEVRAAVATRGGHLELPAWVLTVEDLAGRPAGAAAPVLAGSRA